MIKTIIILLAGFLAGVGKRRGVCRILMERPEGKILLGRLRLRLGINIKTDSRIKRDQLDVTCFIISLFNDQHVSDVNTSILRSLRLIC